MAGKDELVDALLDFLGEPSKERLKGVKAKKSVSKKKTKPKKSKASLDENEVDNENEDNEDEYDDVGDDKVEEEEEEEGDDNVDGEEEQKGEKAKKKKVKKMPSDESLRKWVRAYVRCHNMKNSTIKNALEIAGDKFGVDLTEQKARLKELLTEEI